MTSPPPMLQSLIYTPGAKPTLQVLDQLLIPAQKVYIPVTDVETTWSVIRSMQIRGAPLIAIVAVLGLAVDLHTDTTTQEMIRIEEEEYHATTTTSNDNGKNGTMMEETDDEQRRGRAWEALQGYVQRKMDYLATSRPTAVNLFNALAEVKEAVRAVPDKASSSSTTTTTSTLRQQLVSAVVQHAQFMLDRDVRDNRAIGKHGADELLQQHPSHKIPDTGLTLLTICNTGSLATALHGTALGIVRELRDRQKLHSIVALETRPYNQGSRLTAFELVEEQMPGAKLITDSMAAAYMRTHQVHGVVVGADRVCANGDTANKIGTYHLAVAAKAHHVPFYVASPFTTIDVSLESGNEIPIEERPADEFLASAGAPQGIHVWNPAFDVTPAEYITGIVTEKGVIHPRRDGTFDVPAFMKRHEATTDANIGGPEEYCEQTVDSLPSYLSTKAPVAMDILGTKTAADLECVEVGDGNLNLVFIVTNKTDRTKQIIVKQALPYVRCVGEAWPLTMERSHFEYLALTAEREACPEYVPAVYFFSKSNGLIAMQYLAPPNIILRKGLIQGIKYPTMAHDLGIFCAKTLFLTSGFRLSAKEFRQKVSFWSTNHAMCELTEQVVFTEPYIHAHNNRWTSPQLDEDKKAIENDAELRSAACKWKAKFVGETDALIHADLHTGSVMCSPAEGQTFVIDPEFAFYGPIGFDTGSFIANLFLSYVAHLGRDSSVDYGEWLLSQVAIFWNCFQTTFTGMWDDPVCHTGFLYSRQLTDSPEAIRASQVEFMSDLLTETLGFAGMEMLRRIVGIAHVEDLESISDANVRAKCELHGLRIAKIFIKEAASISSIESAIQVARAQK